MASAARLGVLVVPFCALASVIACGSSDDAGGTKSDGGVVSDGGPEGATGPAHTFTVKTSAPSTTLSPSGPANAKIAAQLADDGKTWTVLTPKDIGVYEIDSTLPRWKAVFICADDNDNVTVDIYDRDASVTELDVFLGAPCELPQVQVSDLTGTFTGLAATTGWLDFGYVFDVRGSVLPPDGTSWAYEIPHVQKGMWDLVFGFRDDDGEPLSKLYLARAQNLANDLVLNADIASAGITLETKNITVTGASAGDSVQAPIFYGVGTSAIPATFSHGVDVGPTVAQMKTGTATYGVVPAASQQPTDLYLLDLLAVTNLNQQESTRGFGGTFHTAQDLALALPAAIPPLTPTIAATTPYPLVAVKTVGRATAASYSLVTLTRITDQVSHDWSYSTDEVVADGAEVDIAMPDLTSVTGFQASWAPDPTETTVLTEISEKPTPFSDGKLSGYAFVSAPLAK